MDEKKRIIWQKILLEIYYTNISSLKFKDGKYCGKQENLKKLNINKDDFNWNMEFMYKLGYFTKNEFQDIYYLSVKGIEVALKLQEHEDNNKFQIQQIKNSNIITWLTLVLVYSAIIQAIYYISIFKVEEYYQFQGLMGIVIIVMLMIVIATIALIIKSFREIY